MKLMSLVCERTAAEYDNPHMFLHKYPWVSPNTYQLCMYTHAIPVITQVQSKTEYNKLPMSINKN